MTFIPSSPSILDISRGLVSGMSHINKFGRNSAIDTGTDPEDIWDVGGLWVPPTAARIHAITFASANDDGNEVAAGTATGGSSTSIEDSGGGLSAASIGDAVINDTNFDHGTVTVIVSDTELTIEISVHTGDPSHSGTGESGFQSGDTYRVITPSSTGASVVHVFGLDENMADQQEFVMANGGGSTNTVNSYYRIFRMHIDGAASRTTTNVGIITAVAAAPDGTTTAQITAGEGQTLMAIYTIPAGKTGYITSFYAVINKVAGVTTGSADISLIVTPLASVDGLGSRTQHRSSLSQHGSSHLQHKFLPYKKILSNTDIVMRVVEVSANGTDVSGGFDIILVDN